MGIFTWVLVGGLVGILVSFLMKARGLSILGYLAASIFGAILGGLDVAYLYRSPGAMNEMNLTGILIAFIGALVANAILRLLIPRKGSSA